MEASSTGERVPLVLADHERIERLKARLEETARRAAAAERRIREGAGRPLPAADLNGNGANGHASVPTISATNAPGFSFRSAPLLAARRLSRH